MAEGCRPASRGLTLVLVTHHRWLSDGGSGVNRDRGFDSPWSERTAPRRAGEIRAAGDLDIPWVSPARSIPNTIPSTCAGRYVHSIVSRVPGITGTRRDQDDPRGPRDRPTRRAHSDHRIAGPADRRARSLRIRRLRFPVVERAIGLQQHDVERTEHHDECAVVDHDPGHLHSRGNRRRAGGAANTGTRRTTGSRADAGPGRAASPADASATAAGWRRPTRLLSSRR